MLRHDLLDKGYHFEQKEPIKPIINLLWLFFSALFITTGVAFFFAIYKDVFDFFPTVDFNAGVLNFIFISTPLIYFVIKAVLTYIYCSGKPKNIRMKLTSNTGMPVWVCRDAFKTRQIIFMYLIPVVLIYPPLYVLGAWSGGNMYLLVLIIIMSFLMSYDLILIIYVIFLRVKYNADYTAINNHAYNLTLYFEKEQIKKIKEVKEKEPKVIKEKKPGKINLKIPKIRVNKNAVFIFVGILAVILIFLYMNNRKIPANISSEAIIKSYDGDIFANLDITLDGYYTGYENLAGNNIIYCGDDGSLIYYNNEKNSLCYKYYKNLSPDRLCIYKNCRSNPDKKCGHIQDFVQNGCYSDGFLYGAVNLYGLQNGYIVRYDIILNTMEKLIEFDMGYDEYVYVQNMEVYGRYLYVTVSSSSSATEEFINLSVVRIDLEDETACILYSDDKDAKNKDKLTGLMKIYENYIITASSGHIYKCDLDMKNFETLTSANNIGQFYVYDDNIYYCDTKEAKLYRYNIISKKQELLLDGVTKFCIDLDFLYYSLREIRETKNESGILISSEFYDNNIIYRAVIETESKTETGTEYIDFTNKIAAYIPESGYFAGEWSVKYNYIYTLLYSESDYDTLSRIFVNSAYSPEVFWKKTLR